MQLAEQPDAVYPFPWLACHRANFVPPVSAFQPVELV
jgi:hypothetical protein